MNQTVSVISADSRDEGEILDLLREHGVPSQRCTNLSRLLQDGETQPLGVLLMVEEAMTPSAMAALDRFLDRQPDWSDLPLLILTRGSRTPWDARKAELELGRFHNSILIERPIRIPNLLSTIRAAQRARRRQYEVRDALKDRDRALEDLRRERQILRVALDNLPVGLIVAKADGGIVMGNSAAERIFGHPVLFSRSVESYTEYVAYDANGSRIGGDQFPLSRAIRSGTSIEPETMLYRRGDGRYAWISVTAAPIKDEEGTTTGGIVAVADIDEQTRAADALRVSEDRFRRLVENASVGVSIADFAGNVRYMNPSLLHTLGYTDEDLRLGHVRVAELTSPEFAEQEAAALERLRQTGVSAPYRKSYRAKNGQQIPFLAGAVVLGSQRMGDAGQEIASFFTDLSTQQRAEAALIQSEKLAAVGRLAASISHEINNPLEAVTNLLYLIGAEELSSTVREYLDTAGEELARVSQIAAQTLRFHRQATGPRAVSAAELLDSVVGLYRGRLLNSGIDLAVDIRSDEPLLCFEGDIRQVLNNLVSNAIDAMRRGGRLRVRASRSRRWSSGKREGIRITVADTGHGMPAATVRHVFEAFYTTKGINGTGLGLWISDGIVRKHGGSLQVRSCTHPDRSGTVFSLFLPFQPEVTALSLAR